MARAWLRLAGTQRVCRVVFVLLVIPIAPPLPLPDSFLFLVDVFNSFGSIPLLQAFGMNATTPFRPSERTPSSFGLCEQSPTQHPLLAGTQHLRVYHQQREAKDIRQHSRLYSRICPSGQMSPSPGALFGLSLPSILTVQVSRPINCRSV